MKPKQASEQPSPVSRSISFTACLMLLLATFSFGQATGQGVRASETNQQTTTGSDGIGEVEILSDTQGVNFSPYLHGIFNMIYSHWLSLIPDEARPPQKRAGETQVRFTMRPNGEVASMHLDVSTHNSALDKAAWGAVAGVGVFPQLPEAFHGPNLELRILFKVNEGPPANP